MANYKAHIANRDGYSSQDVTVEGVINQSMAKKVLEARYPGATIQHVRITSN